MAKISHSVARDVESVEMDSWVESRVNWTLFNNRQKTADGVSGNRRARERESGRAAHRWIDSAVRGISQSEAGR